MIDRENEHSNELPEELRDLERELDSFRIEERPSFGPELRAELERAWAEGLPEEEEDDAPGRPVRHLIAAALGGILVVGALTPPARAGLVQVLESVTNEVTSSVAEESRTAPDRPEVTMDRAGETPGDPSESAPSAPARAEGTSSRTVLGPPVSRLSFPDVADRERTQVVLERFYPDTLQALGIGGTVGLLVWVSPTGSVEEARISRTSGIASLDSAGLRAARELRFHPARRDDQPLATWVEFGIDFRPAPEPRPDPR